LIRRERCRERFNAVVKQWIVPTLQTLQCQSVVLIPVLDGGLSLYDEVDRSLDRLRELDGLGRQCLPIRARSVHGGAKSEIISCPDDHEFLEGQVVLIIDDIADTGHTLGSVLTYVQSWRPAAVLTLTFLIKPRARFRPDCACFCVPDHLFLVGWGMDAGMCAGRREEAIWDAADYIQHRSAKHRLVDVNMIRFARSIGNATLAETIRRLVTEGNWHGRPDILSIVSEHFGS
jgi:hypoxanthine phosphoribosyltransferase